MPTKKLPFICQSLRHLLHVYMKRHLEHFACWVHNALCTNWHSSKMFSKLAEDVRRHVALFHLCLCFRVEGWGFKLLSHFNWLMWKGFVAFWSQIFFPYVLSPLIKIGAVIKSGSLFQAPISHVHTNEETIYDFTLLGDVQGCWFAKPLLLVMPLYEAATQWKDVDKNREEPSTQKQNSVEVEH